MPPWMKCISRHFTANSKTEWRFIGNSKFADSSKYMHLWRCNKMSLKKFLLFSHLTMPLQARSGIATPITPHRPHTGTWWRYTPGRRRATARA